MDGRRDRRRGQTNGRDGQRDQGVTELLTFIRDNCGRGAHRDLTEERPRHRPHQAAGREREVGLHRSVEGRAADLRKVKNCVICYGVLKLKIPLAVFQENAPNAALNFLCHIGDVTKPNDSRYDHLLAIECSGRAQDGNYYNKHLLDPIEDLFIAAKDIPGISTTGIGDGGNELGMGKVKDKVKSLMPKGDLIACDVPADYAVTTADIFLPLYVSLVRPILEYGIQAASPYLAKDIQHLKRVQRLATRMVRGLSLMSYEERCQPLNLPTLEARRLRGDLILAYNILHGIYSVPRDLFFTPAPDRGLRGHPWKLYPRGFRLNRRKAAFSVRIAGPWNRLPQGVVEKLTVAQFKRALDDFLAVNQ
ncbi:uncharacterized protein LOC144090083 [Stigmatopora argus]